MGVPSVRRSRTSSSRSRCPLPRGWEQSHGSLARQAAQAPQGAVQARTTRSPSFGARRLARPARAPRRWRLPRGRARRSPVGPTRRPRRGGRSGTRPTPPSGRAPRRSAARPAAAPRSRAGARRRRRRVRECSFPWADAIALHAERAVRLKRHADRLRLGIHGTEAGGPPCGGPPEGSSDPPGLTSPWFQSRAVTGAKGPVILIS